MEIKINVTSSEEDRKNVELFEFRRRKEEDFKHKLEGRYQKEVVKHGA